MLKLKVFAAVLFGIFVCFILNSDVFAEELSGIVISQVQLGDDVSAKNEFIEIYNNSDKDVDISNWCLNYVSSSLSVRKLVCFDVMDISTRIMLPAYKSVLATSADIEKSSLPIIGDVSFSATLSGTAGTVKLSDGLQNTIDSLTWGVSSAEFDVINPAEAGFVMSRKSNIDQTLLDTGKNLDDFEIILPRDIYEIGFIYDQIDACSNIDGFQVDVPDGYYLNSDGGCDPKIIDVCNNIDDIQIEMPDGYADDGIGGCGIDICLNLDGYQKALPENNYIDDGGNCIEYIDVCLNLDGLQKVMPDGYKMGDDEICVRDLLPIKITELLPNVAGSDIGNEYFEIYNPNSIEIDLTDYVIFVGLDEPSSFRFPIGTIIKSDEYVAFGNEQIKFTLLNTSSVIVLRSTDGELIDQSLAYVNPKEDMAWALIGSVWQYTNQPTRSAKNLPNKIAEMIIEEEAPIVSTLTPCAPNQYRSPETNRCRLIVSSESTLAPCKDGQYRSEETNRCRNIVSDVASLIPCAEGQERNPETNRCRSIVSGSVLGASDLKPCAEGQERNPETNRCRNIVSAMPKVGYAVEGFYEPSTNYVLWFSFGGVGLAAILYGIWEWRSEIIKSIHRLKGFLHFSK